MKKISLLFASTLFFCLGIQAQMTDVTSQYITNAGFEDCDVVEFNDKGAYSLISHSTITGGTDLSEKGWALVSTKTNGNGGVITFGKNVQYGKWSPAGDPGPQAGKTGEKGLCFTGNLSVVYQLANEITLPAGKYVFTVNLWARNGETSNPKPTQQVVNIKTGFMPKGGTEDDLIPAARNSVQFTSNDWSQDVLELEFTEPTTGRFQISYGSSYFVVIDDVKLEYQGGVITTALEKVVEKAIKLNDMLHDNDLSTAITSAQAFISAPTSQADVETQVETLYAAMGTALKNTTLSPVNLTSVFVENPSFETGKIDPWTWGSKVGTVGVPTNEYSVPYIDGDNIVEFAQNGSNSITQTITHLPAGYYAIDVKLNQKATVILGSNETECQGGTDALFLNVHPAILNFAGGDLSIGIKGNASYRCDFFRLFYGKDEASLLEVLLSTVKGNAQAILGKNDFANITGEERSELTEALKGTDIDAINTALNAFVKAKEAYDDYAKAKTDAANFTAAKYPYAKAETLELISSLATTEATSRSIALENAKKLKAACANVVWENAYCEGVANTDYTSKIVGANVGGTTVNSAWSVNNIEAMKLSSYKARIQRDDSKDLYVYGTPNTYTSGTSSMQQTINNMPAGKYVLAVSMMASTDLPVAIRINSKKIATFNGTGTAANSSWNEVVSSFELDADGNITIRLDEDKDSGTKLWYADNFRLYRIKSVEEGIQSVSTDAAKSSVYDLNGRRVSKPVRGLYILRSAEGNKKVIMK